VQSRGDSDTLGLPAGTKYVQEPEASVNWHIIIIIIIIIINLLAK